MKPWIPFINSPPLVAVVRLQGVIGPGGRGGAGLSDAGIGPVLERAFRRGKPKALALVINSPGGSPVQSSLIGARIRRLSAETKVPVYAFVEDVAASGGYWLASSADEIWVDESSIVGSIGVISAGFGLQNLIERFGIERRVHTAGQSKSMLDPFRPEKEEDVTRLKSLLDEIHKNFIRQVESRRGAKLAQDETLFTGEFWLGARAIELGLADGIGHCAPRMKEVFGEKTRFKVYNQRRSLFQRFGLRLAEDAAALIEERSAFARFGL